ncbi:MAG: 4a-hydroxytetrahydrobiopterin dehydratase [Candidatus Woesearchaeota archaeon]
MGQILNDWKEENNTLSREFKFNNFKQASKFAIQLFDLYEELDHHPDTLLYGYKFIKITTTTHDEGNKLTNLDYILAQEIDSLFENFI